VSNCCSTPSDQKEEHVSCWPDDNDVFFEQKEYPMGSRRCVTMEFIRWVIVYTIIILITIWDCFGNEGSSLWQAQKS
jgi:hypothetical protein